MYKRGYTRHYRKIDGEEPEALHVDRKNATDGFRK